MSLWGKIGGAGLGLAIGGPIGALIGAISGHFLVDRDGAFFSTPPKEIVFTTGLIALAAKMARSDGVVVPSEIEAFQKIFDVKPEDKERIFELFHLAKETTLGFEAYSQQLGETFRDQPLLLEDILDGLFHIAKADGVVHEKELAYLQQIAGYFQVGHDNFKTIVARHVVFKNDPYQMIGASRTMSDEALKTLYRKLVKQYHPDQNIAQGLPPEAIRIATERLAVINAAWDKIEKERGWKKSQP